MELENLSVSERIILAEALWDSIANQENKIELTSEQKQELDIRLSRIGKDHDIGSTWSEIKKNIVK